MREIRLPLSAGASLSLTHLKSDTLRRVGQNYLHAHSTFCAGKTCTHAHVSASCGFDVWSVLHPHSTPTQLLLSRERAMKIYQTLNCWTRAIIFRPLFICIAEIMSGGRLFFFSYKFTHTRSGENLFERDVRTNRHK
jgi:hypothetical protein